MSDKVEIRTRLQEAIKVVRTQIDETLTYATGNALANAYVKLDLVIEEAEKAKEIYRKWFDLEKEETSAKD